MDDLISRSSLVRKIQKAQVSLETGDDRQWEINRKYHKGLAWAHRLALDEPAAERHGNVEGHLPHRAASGVYQAEFETAESETGFSFRRVKFQNQLKRGRKMENANDIREMAKKMRDAAEAADKLAEEIERKDCSEEDLEEATKNFVWKMTKLQVK